MSYLSEAKDAAGVNVMELGAQVMAQGGPGSWTQLRQILGLWLRLKGFKAEEYYTYGLWRRDLPSNFLREFQTGGARTAFNDALVMPERGHPKEMLRDKVATETILRAGPAGDAHAGGLWSGDRRSRNPASFGRR
ncbi:MAG: hypothetical protein KA139_05290 [Rhodobacteraceae bacterium]|nr:hypothetical protein [Paracoccaceae bacterium]